VTGHRPSFAELANWTEGKLNDASSARVTRAVADAVERGDAATVATVRFLTRFHDTASTMPLQDAPPIIRQSLQQQFDRWAAAQSGRAGPPIELTAHLVHDSRRDLDLVGLRAGDDSDRIVHLAYSAAGADLVIDVRQQPDGQGCLVDGQAFVDGWDGAAPIFEAIASGAGWSTRTIDGDTLGRFRLQPVAAGELVRLSVTNGEIRLRASLDLRRGAP
jgi:hypothetical protein